MSIYIYTKDQLKKIENAALITANILDELESKIVEGISTFEIDQHARKFIKAHKVKSAFLNYGGFPATVCTSVNDEVIHGIPRKDCILKAGDIVGMDFGVIVDGFFGDSARTVSVGLIDASVQKLLDVTKESLYKAIASVTIDNRVSDISHAVESYVTKFGFKPVREFSGHGIGLNLHEEPSIPNYGKAGRGPRISEGMVFAIEPMINAGTSDIDVLDDNWTVVTADSRYSAHFEHTVAVIDGKAKILTRGINFN
ncbi:MAG: type I methionyl aminopeptidase [Spirochaetes bacterium]|nr:type I methionyl aminopeptidase [Spirochaetota bacterium]